MFYCITSFVSQTNAQGFLDPVTWDVSLEKNSGDLYTITMEAVLEEKWHLYSQVEPEMGPDEIGPIATEFSYNTSDTSFVLVGKTIEPEVAPVMILYLRWILFSLIIMLCSLSKSKL